MSVSDFRHKRRQARKNERVMFPMNIRKLGYVITILTALAATGSAARATTIELEITPNTSVLGMFVDFYDYDAASTELAEYPIMFVHENSEVIPTGLALANVLGYPNGRAMIGQFPHFEFGVSAGVAAYQLFRYEDYNKDNPEIPGGGVNGSFHFGTGIDDRMDVMFKVFFLGSYYTYDRTFEQEASDRRYNIEVTDNSIYSFGIKTRYNIIRPNTRSFFSFGGLNVNLAFDYMYARFATKGWYFTQKLVEFNVFGNENPEEVLVDGTIDGTAAVNWHMFSVTPEVIAYFDVFYFISVYSGFAVSFNRGAVTFETDMEGTLYNRDPIVDDTDPMNPITMVAADQPIATGALHADSSMTPNLILPRFILGFEIDLWALKIQLEGSSLLTSPTDSFTAQVGIRIEF